MPAIPHLDMGGRPVPRFASVEEGDEVPVFVSAARREAVEEEPVFEAMGESAAHASGSGTAESYAQAAVQHESAAAAVAVAVDAPHQDEHGQNLDIPAFMRRGGL